MDMVFNKNVKKYEIEKFEVGSLEKVVNFSLMSSFREELYKRNLNYKVEIIRDDTDSKKYTAFLTIDVFNEKGERVYESDEPNCCLMLCEPICYTHHGHIIGIDLIEDKKFIQSLELLIEQVKKH